MDEQDDSCRSYIVIDRMVAFFWPLQGFFDFCVYFRPRHLHWRMVCPNASRWFALRMTVGSLQAPNTKFSDADSRSKADSQLSRQKESGADMSSPQDSKTTEDQHETTITAKTQSDRTTSHSLDSSSPEIQYFAIGSDDEEE